MEAKKKRRALMAEQKNNELPLRCFLLGGGRNLSFYSHAISPWHFDMTEEERMDDYDKPDVDQLYPK